MNEKGLGIAGLIVVAAGVTAKIAYDKNDKFKNAVDGLGKKIKDNKSLDKAVKSIKKQAKKAGKAGDSLHKAAEKCKDVARKIENDTKKKIGGSNIQEVPTEDAEITE